MCNVDNSAVSVWLTASVSGWESKWSRFNPGSHTVELCPDSLVHNTHCTGRTPTVQSCTLYNTSGNLQDQMRQHQISMFQSLHSGIQESTEYNKKPLTNESEQFQSPSIKADQKSSKTSVSWELSRNSQWSGVLLPCLGLGTRPSKTCYAPSLEIGLCYVSWNRVLLPNHNTLSGIAQVWIRLWYISTPSTSTIPNKIQGLAPLNQPN